MGMSGEIAVTCARELRWNLRSAKGLASLLLFFLGGAATMLVYLKVRQHAEGLGGAMPDPARRAAQRQLLAAVYDDAATVDYLLDAPGMLLFLHNATLFFLPLLVVLLGYDQLAGEMQHRTLRYTTLRARRTSLVLGKAAGLWLAAAAISLALALFTWGAAVVVAGAEPLPLVRYGAHFWLAATVFAGAYVGLTTLVSALFRTPALALLATLGAMFALWIVRLLAGTRGAPAWFAWVRYALPGTWEQALLAPGVAGAGVAAAACLGFGAAALAAACVVMERRDV